MGYLDFPYPETLTESFVSSDDVLSFLHLYADHFDLKKHIRFQHEVIRVKPRCHNKWEVSDVIYWNCYKYYIMKSVCVFLTELFYRFTF